MKPKRVAVTGVGGVCGLGHKIEEIWANLIEGKSGISLIENHSTEKQSIKIAGEVKNFTQDENLMPAKEWGRYDKFVHYALWSSDQALKMAGDLDNLPYPQERMGCVLGVGMGGFPITESTYQTFAEKGARRISPFFIPSIIPNMASGIISMHFQLKGMNYTVSSACASSGHALTQAAYEIMSGRHDLVISGGAESVICDLPIGGFSNMKALSKRNSEPDKASRPFDKDRDGFVMGEGAGVLILEDLEKAKARGARILAEVVGLGSSSDAHHITAPHPEGVGAVQCMENAIKSAKEVCCLAKEDIGYVNAHGTSTPLGDIAETKAIRKVFTHHADNLHVSSTKSMIGHLLGAASGIESVFCVLALKKGILPPTINIDNQDPECDLDYVANQAINKDIEFALNNSFGFGGTNSTIIFKKYK